MTKQLLLSLTTAAILFVSCEKQNDSFLPKNQGANEKDITMPAPQPTPLTSQRVFFMDFDTLCYIDKYYADYPGVFKKGKVTGIVTNGFFHSNELNNHTQVYNPFQSLACGNVDMAFIPDTEEILAIWKNPNIGVTTLFTFDTKTLKATKAVINGGSGLTNIQYDPDLKKIYANDNNKMYTIDIVNNFPVAKVLFTMPMSSNIESTSMDHKKGLVYYTTHDSKLHVIDLKGQNHKILFTSPAGETMIQGQVRFDGHHKKIFFSTNVPGENMYRIWNISISGEPNTLKKVTEIPYLSGNPGSHTLNFELLPYISKIYWSLRHYNRLVGDLSRVYRVNMDGTGTHLVYHGRYINSLLIGDPAEIVP